MIRDFPKESSRLETLHLGEKKVTFRTELLFQTNQSQVCVEALHSSTSKVACHSRFMVSVLCQILKPTLYPTHQVVA